MSVKLLVILTIIFKNFPSTYCLMQGYCFICIKFENVTSKLESKPNGYEKLLISTVVMFANHWSVGCFRQCWATAIPANDPVL